MDFQCRVGAMRLRYGMASFAAAGVCALASAVAAQEGPTEPPVIVPAPPVMIELRGPPPPRPGVITNPTWARMPQARYPERALARGVEGRARLECVVMPNGRLTDCRILAEDPVGVGFGIEALAAARDTARVSPRTVDGAAEPARVTFNVDFRLADELPANGAFTPGWTRPPAPSLPRAARRAGVGGSATLSCRAFSDGRLTDCRVVEETPARYDFGEAALAATRRALLSPDTVASLGPGGRFTFTVQFRNP